MTLYANFTPKQYTVTFQMQDGTELDTQTVDYMTAATAPDTDSVPGWVFAGWDKDFSSITEDTVVTGRYVRESEYARISLPRSTYNLYTSTKITLEPTITPEHLSESKVEWTSGDSSIASVDDKGNVTAVGAGETTITATVVSSGEKAECKVIVKADLATTILLKSNSKLNYRCKAVHEYENQDDEILKESVSLLHILIKKCIEVQSLPNIDQLLE